MGHPVPTVLVAALLLGACGGGPDQGSHTNEARDSRDAACQRALVLQGHVDDLDKGVQDTRAQIAETETTLASLGREARDSYGAGLANDIDGLTQGLHISEAKAAAARQQLVTARAECTG